MAERTSNGAGNAVLVSLLAGMAGAAVALLFAPRSGQETREKIKTTADEALTQAQKELHNAKGSVEQGLHRSKDKLVDVLKHTARKTDDAADKVDKADSPIITNWEDEA